MAAKSAGVLMLAAIILFIAAKQCAAQSRVVRGVVTDESGAVIPKTSIDISCSQTGRVWSDDFVVTNP